MESGTKPSVGRLPRARVTLPLLGLVGAALAAGPIMDRQGGRSHSSILGMAESHGLSPILERPKAGTEIFQWDAEVERIPPYLIGIVTREAVNRDGERLYVVERSRAIPLFVAIRPGEMRYWIKRP